MPRVVVIDDEPSVRRAMGAVLTRAGYEVSLASDGSEGMAMCVERLPDLVITDIHMPETNGFETIAALRTMYPQLPIIAISGGDEAARLELLGSAKLLGAVSSLKKPFTMRELLEAVGRSLDADSRAEGA